MARELIEQAATANTRPTGIPPGMEQEASGEEVPATPEEEAQLEQAVTKIDTYIHGRKSRDAVLDQLNQRDLEIPAAVGRVAAQIVTTVAEQAKANGVELSNDVLQYAGAHAVEELMEVGTAAGFFKIDEDSPEYNELLQLALMEGYKAHGEKLLAGPDADRISAEAQDTWATEAAKEVDAGTADPEYLQAVGGGQGRRGGQLIE